MAHREQGHEQVSPEVRERATRMIFDHEGEHGSRWQTLTSIAAKLGYAPQTLNDRVKRAEFDIAQAATFRRAWSRR